MNTSSGDSLNELSLGLSDTNDDNEKLLANILEECEMEDGKALSQTSNFWNGLLEDNVLANLDLEESPNEPKIDRSVGYTSDAINTYSRLSKKSTRHGHSHFKINSRSAIAKQIRQQLATLVTDRIKEEQPDETGPATSSSSSATTGIKILKTEPMVVKQEILQISSADATASHDYAAASPAQIISATQTATAIRTPPQQQKIQTFVAGDATAVFPTGTAMTTVRQMNGPGVYWNFFLLY